jgi:hypothetical protein
MDSTSGRTAQRLQSEMMGQAPKGLLLKWGERTTVIAKS